MTDIELKEKVSELLNTKKFSADMDGDELQDVVNSRDEVVGVLPRGVIWDNGLENNVRVVNIFVLDNVGKVFLPVRSMKKRYLPGGYDFSCGENVKSGEGYFEAAVRGLKEELGVDSNDLTECGSFKPDLEKGLFCFGRVYLYKSKKDEEAVMINMDEFVGYEWREVVEVREMVEKMPEKFKRDYKAIFELAFGNKD